MSSRTITALTKPSTLIEIFGCCDPLVQVKITRAEGILDHSLASTACRDGANRTKKSAHREAAAVQCNSQYYQILSEGNEASRMSIRGVYAPQTSVRGCCGSCGYCGAAPRAVHDAWNQPLYQPLQLSMVRACMVCKASLQMRDDKLWYDKSFAGFADVACW
jgi:hypothetical protein